MYLSWAAYLTLRLGCNMVCPRNASWRTSCCSNSTCVARRIFVKLSVTERIRILSLRSVARIQSRTYFGRNTHGATSRRDLSLLTCRLACPGVRPIKVIQFTVEYRLLKPLDIPSQKWFPFPQSNTTICPRFHVRPVHKQTEWTLSLSEQSFFFGACGDNGNFKLTRVKCDRDKF